MKKKLKTWEAFEAEFRPFADRWDESIIDMGIIQIKYNDMVWTINSHMKKLFGNEFEVYRITDENYTHGGFDDFSWSWNELWFEEEYKEIEFITKEEVEI